MLIGYVRFVWAFVNKKNVKMIIFKAENILINWEITLDSIQRPETCNSQRYMFSDLNCIYLLRKNVIHPHYKGFVVLPR